MNNVGFIGVGYMGYGIAKNILEKGNNLFVIANKNRKPIDRIVGSRCNRSKYFRRI
jgi:3-hydroxyisobutyrate dehydrogenase-like beta-hydroxyacid dehydrogenase